MLKDVYHERERTKVCLDIGFVKYLSVYYYVLYVKAANVSI